MFITPTVRAYRFSPGDNFKKCVDVLNLIFFRAFLSKIKMGNNAIETGMMCSLAVVAIVLLCITSRIVF